jgi:Ricin-type beta-trefoil lectin domain
MEGIRVKRRRTVSLFIGLLAAVAAGMLVSAPPAAAAGGLHNGEYYELCLQPVGGSMEPGAAIVTEFCNDSAEQDWLWDIGTPVFHWRNGRSGLCMDARGGAANGTPVQQWPCNSISNENWELYEFGPDDPFAVISRVSGTRFYCLDIPNGRDAPGVAMQIYRCNGTPTQRWWE